MANTDKPARSRKKQSKPVEEKNPIQESLIKSTIAVPMLEKIEKAGGDTTPHKLVIVLNNKHAGGRKAARDQAISLIDQAIAQKGKNKDQGVDNPEIDVGGDYLYAHLEGAVIQELVRLD